MDKRPVMVKIIIEDSYLSFEHKIYSGMHCEAVPYYTSTQKLKGYIVKSNTKRTDIFMRAHEVEILPPQT